MTTIREQLAQLSELGKRDFGIRELKERRKTLPKKANEAKDAASDAEIKETILKTNLKDLELKRSQLDLEIQIEKSNLRKWEARADKIKAEREYTTLMSEIGSQKKAISDLETQILQVMQDQDKLKKDLEAAQNLVQVARSLYQEEWAKVENEMSQLASELVECEQIRIQITAQMPSGLLKRYEQIASKRAGLGVAVLIREICQACKRTVPPELFNRVVKGEVLESCPFCQRLLVT